MFGVLIEAIDKLEASEERLDVAEMWRAAERIEFLKLRALREYERSEQWRVEGYLSAAAALRAKCNANHGAVAGALQLARKLEDLPETAAAFASGAISRQHASAIADACTTDRMSSFQEIEAGLSDVAKQMQPKELRGYVKRLTDAIDGDGGAADDEAAFARRRFHLSQTFDRMVAGDLVSDPESGEIIATALDAEMERDFVAADSRSRSQRRHDALVNICRRALDNGELGVSHGVRPHVSVVADITALPGASPELVAQARAEAAHVGHLSRATLERLSCDCDISRVIMAGPSEVLDVGRATRTIPPALWKALVARDRHCTTPGCDRPASQCEAHHITHWCEGGATSLENLELKCPHHHRDEHAPP